MGSAAFCSAMANALDDVRLPWGISPDRSRIVSPLCRQRHVKVWRRCSSSTPSRAIFATPVLSPVWDSALALSCLRWRSATGGSRRPSAALHGLASWEAGARHAVGDWAATRPGLRPGGWAFQYDNPHYLDLDDTAAAVAFGARPLRWAALPSQRSVRAEEWVLGMQSPQRRLGLVRCRQHAFLFSPHIPFADHGALLDPPSADVSARCLGFLALAWPPVGSIPPLRRRSPISRREQEADGSWFGPLGNQLHLTAPRQSWRAECRRCRLGSAAMTPRGRLIDRAATARWRVGRNRRRLLAGGAARQSTLQHAVADGVGVTQPDGGRRSRQPGTGARHRLPDRQPGWRRQMGRSRGIPRSASPAYSNFTAHARPTRVFFPLWALARYRRLLLANSPRVAFGL